MLKAMSTVHIYSTWSAAYHDAVNDSQYDDEECSTAESQVNQTPVVSWL
jgi:hypothetical protein